MKICVFVPKLLDEELEKVVEKLKAVGEAVENNDGLKITLYSDTLCEKYMDLHLWKLEKCPTADIKLVCCQSGGSWGNTGSSTVTALPDGSKPQTVASTNKCNATHAIYQISKGYLIECLYWNKKTYMWEGKINWVYVSFNGYLNYTVAKFKAMDLDNIEIKVIDEELELEGEKLAENPSKLLDAIKVAMEKATCYYCKEEHTW